MQKLLNVKAVKLQCYGKTVKQTFKVFPPTNIEDLEKKNKWKNYECRTVKKNKKNFGLFQVSQGLTANDSLGEFIRRTLNTVTLLKFTCHWDIMSHMGQERQTNVFPKNTSQKSLAIVGWRIKQTWQLSGVNSQLHMVLHLHLIHEPSEIQFNQELKAMT